MENERNNSDYPGFRNWVSSKDINKTGNIS